MGFYTFKVTFDARPSDLVTLADMEKAIAKALRSNVATISFGREISDNLRPGLNVDIMGVRVEHLASKDRRNGASGNGKRGRAKDPPVAKDRCARRGRLKHQERQELPDKAFGLPRKRSYPLYRLVKGKLVPSGSHAANAKARARQQRAKGHLTTREYMQIVSKADRVLRLCSGRGGKRSTQGALSSALRRDK